MLKLLPRDVAYPVSQEAIMKITAAIGIGYPQDTGARDAGAAPIGGRSGNFDARGSDARRSTHPPNHRGVRGTSREIVTCQMNRLRRLGLCRYSALKRMPYETVIEVSLS
jgi:hypothetical protein